jgi:hypothetical protein
MEMTKSSASSILDRNKWALTGINMTVCFVGYLATLPQLQRPVHVKYEDDVSPLLVEEEGVFTYFII